jgi:L-malate glycosyltransferase
MRILHLTLSFERGGRRRAITLLTEGLQPLGVECNLCCLEALGCGPEEASDLFATAIALDRRGPLDGTALGRLVALCRARRVQLIHAHDAASQFAGALLQFRLPGLKLVMTFHRTLSFESARLRDRLRNSFAGLLSQAIITGSRERQAHYLRENFIDPKKVVRIPFGIDTNRFRPDPDTRDAIRRELGLPEAAVVFGAVGHFGEEKGIDVVLHGFRELARRSPGVPVILVVLGAGTPAQRERVEALARDFSAGQVIFAGFRPDVERWFRAFDVFVHAPRLEAFGLVVAEAMATGLPVVATAVGGLLDLVRPRQTGLLIPSESAVELANALQELAGDEPLRRAMGEQAHRIAGEEYTVRLYAHRHLRLYHDVLAGRPLQGVGRKPSVIAEAEKGLSGTRLLSNVAQT